MKNKHIIIALFCAVILNGCKEEKKIHQYAKIERNTIEQKFILKGDIDSSIVTEQGTILEFQSFCFNDSGIINISIAEYFSSSEILLKGLETKTDSGFLETAGMFKIEATNQNGELLKLDTAKPIKVSNPNIDSTFIIFHGNTQDSSLVWETYNSISLHQPLDWTIEMMHEYLEKLHKLRCMNIYKLGWINFDKSLPSEKTNLLVNCEESEGQIFYLKLKDYSTFIYEIKTDFSNSINFNGIPLGKEASIVCLAEKNNEMFYNFMDINTSDEKIDFPELKKTSEDKIKTILDGKFGDKL